MIRFIYGYNPRSHVGQEELNHLRLLNIQDRISQLMLNNVFKINTGTSPGYLRENFELAANVHCFNTRSSCFNFQVPAIRNIAIDTFYYQGIKAWNSLPNDVKRIESYNMFKLKVKSVLASNSLSRENNDFI